MPVYEGLFRLKWVLSLGCYLSRDDSYFRYLQCSPAAAGIPPVPVPLRGTSTVAASGSFVVMRRMAVLTVLSDGSKRIESVRSAPA